MNEQNQFNGESKSNQTQHDDGTVTKRTRRTTISDLKSLWQRYVNKNPRKSGKRFWRVETWTTPPRVTTETEKTKHNNDVCQALAIVASLGPKPMRLSTTTCDGSTKTHGRKSKVLMWRFERLWDWIHSHWTCLNAGTETILQFMFVLRVSSGNTHWTELCPIEKDFMMQRSSKSLKQTRVRCKPRIVSHKHINSKSKVHS